MPDKISAVAAAGETGFNRPESPADAGQTTTSNMTQPQTRNLRLIYYSRADLSIYHTHPKCPEGAQIEPALISTGFFPPFSGSKLCAKCTEHEAANGGGAAAPSATGSHKVELPG